MLESIGFDERKAIEKRVEILNKHKKNSWQINYYRL
jgi:hypothetical protein